MNGSVPPHLVLLRPCGRHVTPIVISGLACGPSLFFLSLFLSLFLVPLRVGGDTGPIPLFLHSVPSAPGHAVFY